jgi:rare lipoprotein A
MVLTTAPAWAGCVRASHYGVGDGFNGRKTASGQRFNAHGMSAAHRTLPFGTHLHVTYPATGRSVTVVVNDRGPAKWTGKSIDLSYGAARALGMGGTGTVCF